MYKQQVSLYTDNCTGVHNSKTFYNHNATTCLNTVCFRAVTRPPQTLLAWLSRVETSRASMTKKRWRRIRWRILLRSASMTWNNRRLQTRLLRGGGRPLCRGRAVTTGPEASRSLRSDTKTESSLSPMARWKYVLEWLSYKGVREGRAPSWQINMYSASQSAGSKRMGPEGGDGLCTKCSRTKGSMRQWRLFRNSASGSLGTDRNCPGRVSGVPNTNLAEETADCSRDTPEAEEDPRQLRRPGGRRVACY